MIRRLLFGIPLLLGLCASSALAQSRFSLDFNGGAAIPTSDLGDAALKTGTGLGLAANVRVLPHLHLYAGWEWHRFVTDEPFLANDYDVEDTGYAFGTKFQHPLTTKLDSWIRLGGLYNHVELEEDGDVASDSGHELGWEAGGGLGYAVSDKVSIMPGVRYRTFSANLALGQVTVPVDVSYVAAEIMVSYRFGGVGVSAAHVR
jgi:opacity protein-like surface antigen